MRALDSILVLVADIDVDVVAAADAATMGGCGLCRSCTLFGTNLFGTLFGISLSPSLLLNQLVV